MQLPKTVSTVHYNGSEVYLLGTAHVSKESVEDVVSLVDLVQPDAICIELCEARYKSIREKDSWKKMDIFQVFKEKKVLLLISQLIMGSFYRKLGKQLEVTPGAEMIQGADCAESHNIPLILADRDIEITLKRVWAGLSLFQKVKLLASLLPSVFFSSEEISSTTVEELKEQDNLEYAMDEMAKSFPAIRQRLIHERDIYLAEKIKEAPGKTIVVVVGAGHVPGIKQRLLEENDIEAITQIPRPSIWPKFFSFSIPLILILVVSIGFFTGSTADALDNIKVWIIANMVLGAVGAIAALAHPITIVVTTLVSPVSSLIPTLPAGIVAGLVEAHFKRPTVEALQGVAEASESLKGWWSNGFTHLLVVFFMASLGSALGAWVAVGALSATIIRTISEYWPYFVGAFTLLTATLIITTKKK